MDLLSQLDEQPLLLPYGESDETAIVAVETRDESLALVPAPPRAMVELENSSVHSEETYVTALTFEPLLRLKIAPSTAVRLVCLALLLCACEVVHHKHSHAPDNGNSDPPINRSDFVVECVGKLSKTIDPFTRPVQAEAIDWFISGPGRKVELPDSLHGCTPDSNFGQLYALIILRGELNITTSSWNKEGAVVMTTSDLCNNKWHRIGCNDQDQIVSLHLSNGDLHGSIPSEIGGLIHLRRLELYKNEGIVGTLPSELGNLVHLEFLYVHETSISGTVPSSLGELTSLKEFFLDDTKIEGVMPKSICALRDGSLSALHADCGGPDPALVCQEKGCCNFCYDHPRKHNNDSYLGTFDTLSDIKRCAQVVENGGSKEVCTSTVMSTGEKCVYCTSASSTPTNACLTPTMAQNYRDFISDLNCT